MKNKGNYIFVVAIIIVGLVVFFWSKKSAKPMTNSGKVTSRSEVLKMRLDAAESSNSTYSYQVNGNEALPNAGGGKS